MDAWLGEWVGGSRRCDMSYWYQSTRTLTHTCGSSVEMHIMGGSRGVGTVRISASTACSNVVATPIL